MWRGAVPTGCQEKATRCPSGDRAVYCFVAPDVVNGTRFNAPCVGTRFATQEYMAKPAAANSVAAASALVSGVPASPLFNCPAGIAGTACGLRRSPANSAMVWYLAAGSFASALEIT